MSLKGSEWYQCSDPVKAWCGEMANYDEDTMPKIEQISQIRRKPVSQAHIWTCFSQYVVSSFLRHSVRDPPLQPLLALRLNRSLGKTQCQ